MFVIKVRCGHGTGLNADLTICLHYYGDYKKHDEKLKGTFIQNKDAAKVIDSAIAIARFAAENEDLIPGQRRKIISEAQ